MQTETDVEGKYEILNIPVGTYNVTASKPDYIPKTVENVEILEDQTTVLNFELTEDHTVEPTGGEDMEYIIDINIVNCEDETIEVPDGCAQKRYKFISAISSNPHVGKIVKLLDTDGTIIQTKTTDADGFASFTNVVHGNHKLKITY